jgi:hypothetical protein
MKPVVSHTHGHEHEHEIEPQYGLPEELPSAEKILWQGSPDWKAMARYAFHVRKLIVYFAVIIAIRMFVVLTDGLGIQAAFVSALWLTLLASAAIGTLAVIAYFSAKTSVYTITNRRIVMRVGIVLTLTFNLPFKRIASADLRRQAKGTGDIPVVLMGNDKIAYVHLWPHVRPWRFVKPEPMMRCVPNAQHVAAILSNAWAAQLGSAASVAGQQSPASTMIGSSRPTSSTSTGSSGHMSAA